MLSVLLQQYLLDLLLVLLLGWLDIIWATVVVTGPHQVRIYNIGMKMSSSFLRGSSIAPINLLGEFDAAMQPTRPAYRRRGHLSAPPIVNVQPRSRWSKSVGGRVASRVSPLIRSHYKLGSVQPMFVNRARSYNIQARDGEQALITFVCNKIRSVQRNNPNLIMSGLSNEYELDTRTADDTNVLRTNFNIQDSLPSYAQGSATISANTWALPGTSWVLGDNWGFRDMILALRRIYLKTGMRHGYLPPSVAPLVAGGTYGNYSIGATSVANPVFGVIGDGDPDVTGTVTSMRRIFDADISLTNPIPTNDQAGAGDFGLQSMMRHLYVHSMGIDFTVTNLEENPIDVVMYELIIKRDVEFQWAGDSSGDQNTTTYCPTNCGLPDPVELWQIQANKKRGSVAPSVGLQSHSVAEDHDVDFNGNQKFNTLSVYEPNMDPKDHLDRWYRVKRRSARIEPGGKYRFQYTLKMNKTCPPWWFDKLYAYGGFTRQYMMRVKGVPGLARTDAGINLGIGMGTTSQDANVRVDVNKSWRASLLPRKQRHSYLERVPRIATVGIAAVLNTDGDGDMETADNAFNAAAAGTTQKIAFTENVGQLL